MRTVNHNLNFVPEVELKKGDTCSLKRHFRGCTREVIGYLDMLARNNPQRFAFCRVVNIVAHCKRYKGKKYGQRMVELSIAYLRDQWFITSEVKLRVNSGIERHGFFVLPHDLWFRRDGNICSPLDRETHWKTFSDWLKSTVPSTVRSTGQSTVASTGQSTVQSTVPVVKNGVPEYGVEYGAEAGLAVETIEPVSERREELRQVSENELAPNRGAESVGLDEKPGETEEPAAPNSDQANVEADQEQGRGKPSPPTSLSSQTDRPKAADMGSQVQTVEQYFERVPNSELIYTLTNTRITPDKLVYKHWDDLTWHCVAAVKKWGPVQVNSKVLGDIMGNVMDLCTQEKTPDPPRSWYAVMKKLRAGEPLLCLPPPPDDGSHRLERIDEARVAAWNAFNESAEGQRYKSLSERGAAFDALWKARRHTLAQ